MKQNVVLKNTFGVYESKRRSHANLCVNHFSSLTEKSSDYLDVKTERVVFFVESSFTKVRFFFRLKANL